MQAPGVGGQPDTEWQQIDESIRPGTLYVVATPIGNLGDFTARAASVLARVDLIAAEDTRRTRLLLDRYGIRTPMKPYHEHNEQKVKGRLLEMLQGGSTIALVSDAGTPGVSDPGYRLIHAIAEQGMDIVPIPGASAMLAALVASGMPLDRFTFEGFLPKKKGRATRLAELAVEARTMVLFESPQRLGRTLADLAESLGGERPVVVCRELTKTYEEFIRGTLGELAAQFAEKPPRGEITLVVEGLGKKAARREKAAREQEEADCETRGDSPLDSPAGPPPAIRFPDYPSRGRKGRNR